MYKIRNVHIYMQMCNRMSRKKLNFLNVEGLSRKLRKFKI